MTDLYEPYASFELGTWLWSIGEHPANASAYKQDFDQETILFAFQWWDNSLDNYIEKNPIQEIEEVVW